MKKIKYPNKIEENHTKPGNPYYLVLFENRTKPGTVLSETVLSGDPLYIIKLTWEITWCVIYLIKVNHTLYNDILYKTTWTSLFFTPRWQHWAVLPSLLYSLVLGIYNFDIHMHPGWTLHWLVVHNSIACPLNIQGFLYFRNLTTTTYILLHRIVYNQESLPIESFLWSHVEKFQR